MKLFPPLSIFHFKHSSNHPSSGHYHQSQVSEKDPLLVSSFAIVLFHVCVIHLSLAHQQRQAHPMAWWDWGKICIPKMLQKERKPVLSDWVILTFRYGKSKKNRKEDEAQIPWVLMGQPPNRIGLFKKAYQISKSKNWKSPFFYKFCSKQRRGGRGF